MSAASNHPLATTSAGLLGIGAESKLSAFLQRALYAQGAAIALPIILTLLSILRITDALSFHARWLLRANLNSPNETVLLAVLLALANAGVLTMLLVASLAQEWWFFPIALLAFLVNLALLLLWQHLASLLVLAICLRALPLLRDEWQNLRINPVMRKEMRARMRGIRAFIVLTIYLTLMSSVAILLYLIFVPQVQATGSVAIGSIGRDLFRGMVALELLLIILIAPAFTAGSITGERVGNTYDLLRLTALPAPSFIIGKLESALAYLLLLMLATAPLLALAFLFGGVSQLELILSFLLVMMTALLFGAVGAYYSAGADGSTRTNLRSYSIALVIILGFPLVLLFLLSILEGAVGSSTSPIFEGLLIYSRDALISLNPFLTALNTQQVLVQRGIFALGEEVLASNGARIPIVASWISFTISYLLGTGALVVLTIRRLRQDLD